ncbi:thiamine pyrophosphate-binding protein [Beggiatoa leptomitoformis]|uniref:Thiamine pyrophosphate-binding protein n=1 Tax=Beggiatoa leptomitoformis TaxID=288004 RepID=A0A2N9YI67_9GAMM|nr:thiamine pyrophosphate-binding protein [Beggiatoa leptomitoformis]ALG67533.1 thiamine pyrophosphate-binding protein [Beggiatoa leptomitoformis]AUI70241.1 thiamine pyrophosphate-binding protein [Beggiatoa leptomitoformis]
MPTLADLAVRYLKKIGVQYVFGIPGGAIAPLYDALARGQLKGADWPKAIVARHETGAAFMADGYARETGKLGVCCATTGPGTTNLITGVASAYLSHTPMLVITAQTILSNFGKGSFQESSPDGLDTQSMFDQCTNYSSIISHPDQFEGKLLDAITAALRHPQGPAHLSVPIDVFKFVVSNDIESEEYETEKQYEFDGRLVLLANLLDSTFIDESALDRLFNRLIDLLKKQKKIVFLIGSDCEGAIDQIVKLSELLNALMVTTPEGKTWINSNHPLYRGVFGFAGHLSARKALADKSVGLILAIGTSLGEWSTDGWDKLLMNNKLVHVHHTPKYFSRSYMACLHVCGRLTAIFNKLHHRLEKHITTHQIALPKVGGEPSNVLSCDIERRTLGQACAPRHIEINAPEKYRQYPDAITLPIKPQRLMCELTLNFPSETRFLADTGNSFAWTTHYLFPKVEGRYQVSMAFGSMGWAIGASIGTALATPSKLVVCITGDGSYLMSGQEITVAVEQQLTIVFVILNDQALGMVMHGQRLTGAEMIGFKLPPVDFAMMARAVGAQAYTIRTLNDMQQLDYKAIATHNGPTLLDIHIDSKEVPPMEMRVRALNKS